MKAYWSRESLMTWDGKPALSSSGGDFDPPLLLTATMIAGGAAQNGVLAQAGKEPPALAHATAPAGRPWRGIMIAAFLHVLIIGAVLGLIKLHMPPPPDEGPVISVVVETLPQGSATTAAPQPQVAPPPPIAPHLAQTAAAAPLPSVTPPAPVVPVVNKPADIPPPVPAPTPRALPVRKPVPAQPPAPPSAAQAARLPLPAQAAVTAGPKTALAVVGVTRPARAVSKLTVYYSLYSQATGEQGQVGLGVVVLANGQVGQVTVTKSSGFTALDNVARNAVMNLHFQPALKNGVPVASVLPYLFKFELQGP